jgi:hypothetical protein
LAKGSLSKKKAANIFNKNVIDNRLAELYVGVMLLVLEIII